MKFKGMKREEGGTHIFRYNLEYETEGRCSENCLYYDTFGKYKQMEEPNYGQE